MSRLKSIVLDLLPKPLRNALRLSKEYRPLWRLLCFRDAAGIVFNRFCYGLSADKGRRMALNESKHRMVERVLMDPVFKDFPFEWDTPKIQHADPASLPIWICWLQGKDAMPLLNQVCVESIMRNAGSHPVRFLTEETLSEWVEIPGQIRAAYHEGKMIPAVFCDYIRCLLLYRHGGVWLDSTILLTAPLGMEWFSSEWMSVRVECADNESVSCSRWASYALGATPSSPFFRKVCEMFERYFSRLDRNMDYLLIDYFFDVLVRSNEDAASMFSAIPYSNPRIHDLRALMNEPFDADVYASLTSESSLFKLTYKMQLLAETGGKETFWGHLLSEWKHDR